ncbi:hypothetical protein [Bacillus atrophaeus]|uniref:hypothetical protein n=1 Tax=Bacillus atrophaeus TaxID=1452 RepID=UPI00227F3274|nr:hypothetical protein [Bacillus atrophaeus]MCY8489252.1 hypothetical protein [Bacillus atrophaeus]MCY8815975.1 hypothetical protein [Bacillus atrophaeus]
MQLKHKDFFSILGQWIFFGSIIGIVVGTTTNFLLETNDYLGDDIRAKRDWLVFLLPFGGIIIGYIYMNYGIYF